MKYIVVGLGNPGDEYMNTRHNTGRLAVEFFANAHQFPEFYSDKKIKSDASKKEYGNKAITLLLPNTFMNKSGTAVKKLVVNKKVAERMIIIHDDIDIPFGSIRIVFGRGSGGHKGVESIIRAVKTKDFVRIRVGVAPISPSGKIKKPIGETKVYDFLLGVFKKKELEELQNIFKITSEAIMSIIVDGRIKAMNKFN